ncbi:hypothetical protein [Nocardia australiensis]|uniref:hypothetical protein n=1 Tax=Nocardia australiensis TaxID=2887191 RepID=UPI001D13920A|nr:hypothetical protein [Nocardia australiensis]
MGRHSERPSTAGRLSVVDEIFLRTHHGLGTPIALQGLWRTADRIDSNLLHQVHTALRGGPLGRRVVGSRIPGARPAWQPNTRAWPLDFTDEPIPVDALLDWADGRGGQLDPEFGPGWRLSAAALDDDGSVVCLTCSHALADGRALALAVDDALSGRCAAVDRPNSVVPISDWSDARRQWSTVLRGTAHVIRQGIARRNISTPSGDDRIDDASHEYSVVPHRGSQHIRHASSNETYDGEPTAPRSPMHGTILQYSVADWDRTAEAQGATANSLFISLIATILWDSGFPHETIAASLPVDTRDEPRVDNDLAMTEIVITRTDTAATIRDKSRIAYERRMSSPGGLPEEILQLIPDRWAYELSRGAGERDILCSNIGTLPTTLRTLGPHHCTGVAARAIHPALTSDRLPRTRLSGYLCRSGDDYTLSLVSLDPHHVESAAALESLARAVMAGWQIPLTRW